MSIFEFDQELHDKTIRKESWEDGKAEGECFKVFAKVMHRKGERDYDGKRKNAVAETI